MAAFTTLALIGLAAGGAFAASKVLAKGPSDADREKATGKRTPNDAPAPTLLGGEAPAPPSAAVTGSSAAAAAKQAADKQRKKATAGATLLTGKPVARSAANTGAPRSLIGY
jgi:hypothetical protein